MNHKKIIFISVVIGLVLFFIKEFTLFSNINNLFIYQDDTLYEHVPQYQFLRNSLLNGDIPIYTNTFSSGFPYMSLGFNALLHPLHVFVAYILPLPYGIKMLYVLIIVLLCISISYGLILLNEKNIIAHLIAVSAIVYSYFVNNIGGYTLSLSFALSPLILILGYKTITEVKWKKYFWWFVFLGGVQLYAFYVSFQWRFYTILFIILIINIIFFENKKLKKSLRLILSFILMLIIAYPQIKVSFELSNLSIMLSKWDGYFLKSSLYPTFIFNLFKLYPIHDYTQANTFANFNPLYGGRFYYGQLSPIIYLLSFFSLFHIYKKKIILLMWIVIVLTTFLALGKYTPFYYYLIKYKFIFSQSIPARWILWYNIIFPFLSYFGLIAMLELSNKTKRKYLIIYGLFAILCTLFASYFKTASLFIEKPNDYFHEYQMFVNICKKIYELGIDLSLPLNYFYFPLILIIFILICIITCNRKILVFSAIVLITIDFFNFQDEESKDKYGKNKYINNYNEYISNVIPAKLNIQKLHGFYDERGSKYCVSADYNQLFNISHTLWYNYSLENVEYKKFINKANSLALEDSNYTPLKYLGVDVINTKRKLGNVIKTYEVGDGFYFYKISNRKEPFIYEKLGEDIIENNFITETKDESNLIEFKYSSESDIDIVVFRNTFKGFQVYLDDNLISYDKYFSFFYLKNLPKGSHKVKIEMSYFKLFLT